VSDVTRGAQLAELPEFIAAIDQGTTSTRCMIFDHDGAEVAQVYVGDPTAAGEPPNQLKGFQKVTLRPGQTTHLTLHLDQRAFSVWDSAAQSWRTVPGDYHIRVGDSSVNLPLNATVHFRG